LGTLTEFPIFLGILRKVTERTTERKISSMSSLKDLKYHNKAKFIFLSFGIDSKTYQEKSYLQISDAEQLDIPLDKR
jgi:hypothetical protein